MTVSRSWIFLEPFRNRRCGKGFLAKATTWQEGSPPPSLPHPLVQVSHNRGNRSFCNMIFKMPWIFLMSIPRPCSTPTPSGDRLFSPSPRWGLVQGFPMFDCQTKQGDGGTFEVVLREVMPPPCLKCSIQ